MKKSILEIFILKNKLEKNSKEKSFLKIFQKIIFLKKCLTIYDGYGIILLS